MGTLQPSSPDRMVTTKFFWQSLQPFMMCAHCTAVLIADSGFCCLHVSTTASTSTGVAALCSVITATVLCGLDISFCTLDSAVKALRLCRQNTVCCPPNCKTAKSPTRTRCRFWVSGSPKCDEGKCQISQTSWVDVDIHAHMRRCEAGDERAFLGFSKNQLILHFAYEKAS